MSLETKTTNGALSRIKKEIAKKLQIIDEIDGCGPMPVDGLAVAKDIFALCENNGNTVKEEVKDTIENMIEWIQVNWTQDYAQYEELCQEFGNEVHRMAISIAKEMGVEVPDEGYNDYYYYDPFGEGSGQSNYTAKDEGYDDK